MTNEIDSKVFESWVAGIKDPTTRKLIEENPELAVEVMKEEKAAEIRETAVPKIVARKKKEPSPEGLKELEEFLSDKETFLEERIREEKREYEPLDLVTATGEKLLDIRPGMERTITSYDPEASCSTFDLLLDDVFSQVSGAGDGICKTYAPMESDIKTQMADILLKWDKEDRDKAVNPTEFVPMDRTHDITVLRGLASKLKMYEQIGSFCNKYEGLSPAERKADGTYSKSLCQEITSRAIPAIMYNLFSKEGLIRAGYLPDFWKTFYDKFPVNEFYDSNNRLLDADGLEIGFKSFGETDNVKFDDAFSMIENHFVANNPKEGDRIKSFLAYLPETMTKYGLARRDVDKRGKMQYYANVKQVLEAYFGKGTADKDQKRKWIPLKSLKGLKGTKTNAGTWSNAMRSIYHFVSKKGLIPEEQLRELADEPYWFGIFNEQVWSKLDPDLINNNIFRQRIADYFERIVSNVGLTEFMLEGYQGEELSKKRLTELIGESKVTDPETGKINEYIGLFKIERDPDTEDILLVTPDKEKILEFLDKRAIHMGMGGKTTISQLKKDNIWKLFDRTAKVIAKEREPQEGDLRESIALKNTRKRSLVDMVQPEVVKAIGYSKVMDLVKKRLDIRKIKKDFDLQIEAINIDKSYETEDGKKLNAEETEIRRVVAREAALDEAILEAKRAMMRPEVTKKVVEKTGRVIIRKKPGKVFKIDKFKYIRQFFEGIRSYEGAPAWTAKELETGIIKKAKAPKKLPIEIPLSLTDQRRAVILEKLKVIEPGDTPERFELAAEYALLSGWSVANLTTKRLTAQPYFKKSGIPDAGFGFSVDSPAVKMMLIKRMSDPMLGTRVKGLVKEELPKPGVTPVERDVISSLRAPARKKGLVKLYQATKVKGTKNKAARLKLARLAAIREKAEEYLSKTTKTLPAILEKGEKLKDLEAEAIYEWIEEGSD